jgi:hypothetical protein
VAKKKAGVGMIRLSLTEFVDIVSRSGLPKANKIAQIKNRPDYGPASDFYKPLREHIIEVHKLGGPKESIDDMMDRISDKKKVKNYPGVIDGYKKWWGRKSFNWFDPKSDLYEAHGVSISVNPELGLAFSGNRNLIKLYFKPEPLSGLRIAIITHLMEVTLGSHCNHREVMGVLDIRNSKLISYNNARVTNAMINAELAYIAELWS